MRPSQLRCQYCGTRQDITLGEGEERLLQKQGYVERACRVCGGAARFETVEIPGGSLHPDDAPSPEQFPRVLLIDDDPDVLDILGRALRNDFDVEVAPSARDAITRLARADYDVILSDIRMPDFDGKALFGFLSQHLPEYYDRVIFLTGDTSSPETVDFLHQCQAPYLTKPIDLPMLFSLIRRKVKKAAGGTV